MKLGMNEFGLFRTEDGLWGIRKINEYSWAIQHRDDPNNPYDWKVVSHETTQAKAIKTLSHLITGLETKQKPVEE